MLNNDKLTQMLMSEMNRSTDKPVSKEQIEAFLEGYVGADHLVSSEILVEKVKRDGIRQPMTTGIESLDEILGGFYEEQVIVVSARPKSGKTSFALHLIDLMKDREPLFLPLEQSALELIEQRIEKELEVPHFYAPESLEGIERTVEWVHLKILESQYKTPDNPTKFVVIDHFGYLMLAKSSDQATWSIINAMQELKQIAKQTKTAIVVVVHTTKGDATIAPTTEDLFGSAGFHQEADTVLSLWRETYKEDGVQKQTNNVLLQVLANRRKGASGAVKFKYIDGQFLQYDWTGHDEEIKKSKKDADDAFKSYG